jgi:hypothetical protein
MKKILFCLLLMAGAILANAQSVPQRTSDPAPVIPAQNTVAPMKSGGPAATAAKAQALPLRSGNSGAATAKAVKAEALPLRSTDGGGGGSTGGSGGGSVGKAQTLANSPLGNTANTANTQFSRPSDRSVKQDSLQKH